MEQKLETKINSPLLYTKEDGRQDYIHDTMKEFYLAKYFAEKINQGEEDIISTFIEYWNKYEHPNHIKDRKELININQAYRNREKIFFTTYSMLNKIKKQETLDLLSSKLYKNNMDKAIYFLTQTKEESALNILLNYLEDQVNNRNNNLNDHKINLTATCIGEFKNDKAVPILEKCLYKISIKNNTECDPRIIINEALCEIGGEKATYALKRYLDISSLYLETSIMFDNSLHPECVIIPIGCFYHLINYASTIKNPEERKDLNDSIARFKKTVEFRYPDNPVLMR